MNIEETKKHIISDTEFVLSEAKKIQELFKMKKVIRYHHTREEDIDTESVAEHVYGMMILIEYFMPLEDTEGEWNYQDIVQIALYHDIDEILTGDIIGYMKTDQDREREFTAQKDMVDLLPESAQASISNNLKNYESQKPVEARFVKAIDKIEPLFHLFSENGRKILHTNKTTHTQNRSIKDKYLEEFVYIKKFNEIVSSHMLENNYFYSEST